MKLTYIEFLYFFTGGKLDILTFGCQALKASYISACLCAQCTLHHTL